MLTKVEIRIAGTADGTAIRSFLKREWKQDHIFLTNQDIFMWQHHEPKKHQLNFLLFEENGAIQSILGYIPSTHFSARVSQERVFLAIWKTAGSCKTAGAGFHLFQQIRRRTNADFIGAIGVSDTALPIYKRLGFTTGLMDHFVVFNADPPAKFLPVSPVPAGSKEAASLVKVSLYDDSDRIDQICQATASSKNSEFLINRYSLHPSYVYEAYLVSLDSSQCVIIAREITVGSAVVCRVVDMVGSFALLAKAFGALSNLVSAKGYEYLDIYVTGLDAENMTAGGYFLRGANSEVVVPNNFEPVQMKNTDLSFAWRNFSPEHEVVLFRGDSDQDRPNQETQRA